MATYEEIYGKRVEVLDADPTLTSAYEGQVWYNSTTGTLKSVVSFGAYSSGGNMNAGVSTMGGGGASSSQAISAKGNPASPPSDSNAAESYNGTGWASLPTTNVAMRNCAGASQSSTSAVVFGGTPPIGGQTELWDGSSWTNKTAMNNSRENLFGAGSGTAALAFGGNPAPNSAKTEEWSGPGNSWTNKTDMSQVRADAGAGGSVTSALVYGGSAPPGPRLATTEEYNGSSWTTKSDLNTTRSQLTGTGPNADNQIAQGGNDGSATAATETWDGTSWTTTSNLSTARIDLNSGGTNTDAVAFGGAAPPSSRLTTTEEYDFSVNTVTNAAWASGGPYPINNYLLSGAGPQTAAIAYGGRNYPGPNSAIGNAATYDGGSWTAIPSLSTGRYYLASAKEGTQTAAMCVAGQATTGATNATEEYDGSSWTGGGAYPISTSIGDQGAGTQTAAIAAGGYGGTPTPYTAVTATYNGSSWTALSSPSNLNTARAYGSMCGPQTAALLVSGQPGTGGCESWNGSAWTAVAVLGTTRNYAGAAGDNTSALAFGGELPPGADQTNVSESWDGSAWSASANLGTLGYSGASSGSSTSALYSGGTSTAPRATSTEEFTGASSTLGPAQTLTTS